MEQNKLFKSDSQKWDQSETSEKFSDSMVNGVKTITKQKLPNVESSSILSEQNQVETTMLEYVSELREERVVLFRLPFRGSTENSVSEFSSIRKCRTIIHYFGIQE